MKMRKLLCTAMAIILAISTFAGCGSKEASSSSANQSATTKTATGDNQTITFWNVFTGSDGEILKSIVNKYNSENKKGIKIEMQIMPNDTLQQKLPAAIATKTAPTMVLFGVENLATYVSSGSLEDLSDFWTTTSIDKNNFLSNVLDLSYIDGKLYGTPMQYNASYLYWNKDLFKAAGLDPEKPPKTLDELATYAVKLTNPAKKQFGLSLPKDAFYPQFLWANGGDVVDLKNNKNLLNSDANLKTLTWLQDLAVNKKVTPTGVTGSESDTMLQNGQIAMAMSGPWQINGLRKNNINFGVTAVPSGSAGQASPAGGCSYVIPKGTDSNKKAAAFDFMKYWLSDPILKEWSQKNGFPVWSKTLANDTDVKNDAVLSSISKATEIGKNMDIGYSKATSLESDVLKPMFEKVITGGASPKDALKQASDQFDTIIAK